MDRRNFLKTIVAVVGTAGQAEKMSAQNQSSVADTLINKNIPLEQIQKINDLKKYFKESQPDLLDINDNFLIGVEAFISIDEKRHPSKENRVTNNPKFMQVMELCILLRQISNELGFLKEKEVEINAHATYKPSHFVIMHTTPKIDNATLTAEIKTIYKNLIALETKFRLKQEDNEGVIQYIKDPEAFAEYYTK